MRKFSLLLSVLVPAAMILAACGGEETSTVVPTENVPPATAVFTATSEIGSETATEVPTEATTTTGTTATLEAGIPVTGGANSDRLSTMLDFTVMDQSGEQAGKVNDMVLDLSKAKVVYVVVDAGGKKIPVPWAFLKVGPASASSYPNPNEQQKAFTLQADTETLKNAPELNVKNMPQLGEAPDSWDIAFRKYWEGGGATLANNTPAPAGTAVTDLTATATSSSNSTGTSLATATPSTSGAGTSLATSTAATSAGTSQGNGTGQGATAIQGVQLASMVLGSKVKVGVQGLGVSTTSAGAGGTGTSLATATSSASGAGTGLATPTPSTSNAGTSLATATLSSSAGTGLSTSTPSTSTSLESLSATIDDLIVNTDSGDILYIVVKTSFADGEHLIPVPLGLFQLSSSGQTSDTNQPSENNRSFVLNADAAILQNAPFFQNDQFPDLTMPDWNSEFDSFWQNNGSGVGSGTGAQIPATATP